MQTSPSSDDEIDLLHLLARFTRFLLGNWLVIGLSFVVCFAISWLSFRSSSKAYASEMVVQAKFLSETYASQVIKGLQSQINERNDSLLAGELNLTRAEVLQVQSISVASPFSERVNMIEEDKVIFLISVEVSDPKVLPRLQAGLVHFFENLEYIKLRVAERKKSYNNLLERIDLEIGKMEKGDPSAGGLHAEIQTEKNWTRQKTEWDKDKRNPMMFDPSTMSVFMTGQRNDAREKLALLFNGIEVIQGFVLPDSPVKPKFSVYIASGVSGGILLSLILVGLRSIQWLFKKYPA